MNYRLVVTLLVVVALVSGSAHAQECTLDVFNLDVEDGVITGQVDNIGAGELDVTYQLFVNDLLQSSGTFPLPEGDVETITNDLDFPIGDHQVRLEAAATCGAFDSETIVHVILEQFSCMNPNGIEGQNHCNCGTEEYQVCQGGSWLTINQGGQAYHAACDSACTQPSDDACIEQPVFMCNGDISQQFFQHSDCSLQFVNQQFCENGCSGGLCVQACQEGFLPEFSCEDDFLLQEYRYFDDELNICQTVDLPVQYCTYGCEEDVGACEPPPRLGPRTPPPVCDILVEGVDFVSTVEPGQATHAKVTVKNTGSKDDITVSLFIGNVFKGSQEFVLDKNKQATRTFFFTAPSRNSVGQFKVEHDCGAEDFGFFDLIVSPRNDVVYYHPPTPAPPERADTFVTILPPTIDIPLYGGKSVTGVIESKIPQDFSIHVHGLPDGFADYPPRTFVQSSGEAIVYITPDELGTYPFTVTITALEEGKQFTRDISLFVVPPERFEAAGSFSLLPLLIAIIAIIIVALIIVVYATREDNGISSFYRSREYY